MDSSVQMDSKSSAAREQEDLSVASIAPVSLPRNVDPDLALAIAQISPERRVEIEKKLKLKLDFFMFPLLLIFYILNYLVWQQKKLLWIYAHRSSLPGSERSGFRKDSQHREGS